jgi:hypothetical protein
MKLTKCEWLLRACGQIGMNRMVMGLIVICLMGMILGPAADAQAFSTTTVQGTVYLANGKAGAGTLNVSWPAFTTANNQAVTAGRMTVTIAPDGFMSANLAPNLGATPAGLYYTAIYHMSDGTTSTEYWVVPAAAQAALGQVRAQLMPAAQAVQAVSKAYVDQSIAELTGSLLTASGGNLSGPLYLNGDPTQALQAADKHYVDATFGLAVPLSGGKMTGPLTTPAVNGVQTPVAGSPQTNLQAAMNAAGSGGAMGIPPTYAGSDGFTNPNGVYVTDLRTNSSQQFERSVKEFGAVCDGTTDDTNALQAALNYAQTHGVALTIPQGTCKTRSLNWHGESIGGLGKQVSALMGFPGQDVLATVTDSMNLLANTQLHDLTIYVDQSLDVSCSPAVGRAPAGSCAMGRQIEKDSIFSPGGNGLTGTTGTGAAWAVGNCAIAMPAATGAGGNGLRVAEIENLEIVATGVDPMAAQYAGAHSTHTCGLYLGQWPQWSEFRNIDIRGLNTGIAIAALQTTTPVGLNSDSNRWQNITVEAAHGFMAAAGSNNVLDNVVLVAGNSAATGEPPTGLVLDLATAQQGWTVRNAVVMPAWNAVQPQLTVTVAGGAVTGVIAGPEHGLGFDPYGAQVPLKFSGSCTAHAVGNVNSDGSIETISVTQGGVGCSGTTTASVDVAGTWDTAAPVNLISGQNMTFFGGNLLKGNGGYSVWNATGSQNYGTQFGGGGKLAGGGAYAGLVANNGLGTAYQVDQFPGADFGVKLQACVGTVSSSYGGTCDARNFTGNLAMGSNLTISTANVTVLLPCATIATANQMIVTAGTRNVALRGCALRGASSASGSQGGTVFLYSGTGAMVQVGDPTYAADTNGFHLDNVVINTTAASNSTAQGLVAYRTQEMDLESLYFLGNSNQTGMTLDGTGNYTGGTFFDNALNGFQTAVSAIGHQVSNPATTDWMNASTFVRLHINCPTSGGSPIANTYGINLAAGDGNTFTGGDVEGCNTAFHLGANAQNNTIVGLRNENSNSQVVADVGSSYNNWMTGGTMFAGQLTDNGTRNSFLDTFHRSFNGMNGDWYGSQKDATVTNHFRIGIGTGNERGLLDRYQTDYGYRWTTGLTDATAGEQFYQVLDELNNVNRLSIGQYNNGQPSTNNQTAINAAGTGAVILNGSNNAGTGGVVIGSGGASATAVATINNAGNAQLNGTLQVGGTSTFFGTPTVKNQANAEIDATLWAGLTTSQKESFTYKDWNGSSQWYMVKDASNNWALNSAVGGLDSFKAYQSTNSGDTYINASNPSGAVRINYESGSGAGFNIYGGASSTLYASFTAANAIKFPGLAAGSGHSCLQIDNSGYVSNTGSTCGSGSVSLNGTVGSGSDGQIAYYAGSGTSIGGMSAVPVTSGGTGASTQSAALTNLGVPVQSILNFGAVSGQDSTAAIQAASDAAGDYGVVLFPPGTYIVTSKVRLLHSFQQWQGTGGTIECSVPSDACIQVGPDVPSEFYMHNQIINLPFKPKGHSTGSAIKDNGFDLTLDHISGRFATAANDTWQHLIDITIDENFVLKGLWNVNGIIQCDAMFCGSVLYAEGGIIPGAALPNAAVGWVSDSNFSTQCMGNDIDWQSGNDLHLTSVIMQGYPQFGLRAGVGVDDGRVLASKVHNESAYCTNPQLHGQRASAGYVMNGGTFESTEGQLGGALPTFTASGNTGSTAYWYWVIVHSALYGDTAPMPVGKTTTAPGSWTTGTSITVEWPSIAPTSGDAITCSLLRGVASPAPYPNDGVQDQVATGIPCGSGTYTSYADTAPTASLTTYAFATRSQFEPYISFWPGSVILGGANINNSYNRAKFIGTCAPGASFVTVQGYDDTIDFPQVTCTGGQNLFQMFPDGPVTTFAPGRVITGFGQVATVLDGILPYRTPTNVKGVFNLGLNVLGDAIEVSDSNTFKTRATAGNRPVADPGDNAIGGDGSDIAGRVAVRGGASISQYVNHLFDGTAWLERLTSTMKTFKVPVTITPLNVAGIVTNTADGLLGTEATITPAQLPHATASAIGGVKCDGTTITCAVDGTISAGSSTSVAFTAPTISSYAATIATGGAALTNAQVQLAAASTTTINVSGLVSGASFNIVLTQDATGGNTVTLGAGCTWKAGTNAGFVTSTTPALTAAANGVNILSTIYNGLTGVCYYNVR